MMLKKPSFFSVFFFFLTSVTCFADQAAWINKSDAYKAGEMISPGMVLRQYCAPCGDVRWTDLAVKQVKVKNVKDQLYEVSVNGKGTDLAYIYIEKNGKWMNLAMVLGLDVSGVPKFLTDQKAPAHKKDVRMIDKILDECIAKHGHADADMANCTYEAYDLWDAELNRVYNQLRAMLKPAQKKALKAAQLKWLEYRDAEFELIDSIYSLLEGTMYKPMRASDRMEIVKKRVLELESHVSLHTLSEND